MKFLPLAALLLLSSSSASAAFEQRLLASPEVQLAQKLGVNSVTYAGGVLTASVTQQLSAQRAAPLTVQQVQAALKAQGLSPQLASRVTALNTVTVAYSAPQVARYAGAVEDVLDGQTWPHTISADFQRGQVAVSLDVKHHEAFKKLLGSRVPAAALRLGGAPQLRTLSDNGSPSTNQYIQERVRPWGGGARINSGGLECSAGWFGVKNGETYLVTAAHCVNPSRTTSFYQYLAGDGDLIGATTNVHRSGTDAIAIRLTTTNYSPEALVADDWSGRIISRESQKGGAPAPNMAQKIKLSGATSYRREWTWFVDFNRIAVQKQRIQTDSGFVVDAYTSCIVASYDQAKNPRKLNGAPQGGDSGGVLLNEASQVMGTMTAIGPFDPTRPARDWEMAYCFTNWDDATRQTGVTPISK
ncbi:S1 family peptidase [Deinococcus sp. HMF7604]|uniref:S1 family peptidase n=1 Tax=Deinococcus betulae TaxID=2873312 RepID=UPI001CCD3D97|nr:S1 family peptidase [Deinococcus betulae]MBZ9751753.1 S1 family peptidase [Deinococcus betulae]